MEVAFVFFSTWHAWMSLLWLWHGGPKAPLLHCCCPGAPGRGWGFPAGPPEPGGCSCLSPRQQGKRVLGGPAKRGEAGHLDLLPPGLTHGGTQRGLPIAGHSPGDGGHTALRRWVTLLWHPGAARSVGNMLLFHGELGPMSWVTVCLRWRVRTEYSFSPWSCETRMHHVHLFIRVFFCPERITISKHSPRRNIDSG